MLGIRFTKTGKLCYAEMQNFLLKSGDLVIAQTDKGLEMGRVVSKVNKEEIIDKISEQDIVKIERQATPSDIKRQEELKEKAKKSLEICKNKIKKYNLDMKLVFATYTLDESKVIFYFTAEQRVDFRDLVKELANEFKTRIELRQIGPRDEVKSFPSLGTCGKELCCRTFLPDFESVTIKTAKEQGLQINMQKLSGCCGKLKCCLKYEEDIYKEKLKTLPKMNEIIEYQGENGKVVGQDILAQKLKLKLGQPGEERFVFCHVDEVKRINKKGSKEEGSEE